MVKTQFQVSYSMLNEVLENIDEQAADFQLENASNNIKWQLGHLLSANEAFVFGTHEESNILGEKLGASFAPGTSPQNFTGDEPSFNELKAMVNDQLKRILDVLDDQLKKNRQEPIAHMDTFKETIDFAILHTNYHTGQINLYNTMISKLDRSI